MEYLNQIEAGLLLWIQECIRNDVLDVVMPMISKVNNSGLLAIVTVVMLLLYKKTRRVGITAGISLFIEYLVVNVLVKPSVMRIRPFVVNEMLQLLGDYPTDYSFPSGHTGCAFAVAFVCMGCLPKKWGRMAIIIATLIAFSRLYNAAHYPTDVLAAILISGVTAWIARYIVDKMATKRKMN